MGFILKQWCSCTFSVAGCVDCNPISMFSGSRSTGGGRTAAEAEEEAAALQVRVWELQLSSSPTAAAAQDPQRPPEAAGSQAVPRRHQDHRQLPRSHDQQSPQQPPPPGVLHPPCRSQARGAPDDAPLPNGDARRHRRLPPTETRSWLYVGAQREAEGSQLSGFLPSGGRRGELQPDLTLSEGPRGGQGQGPVQQISPSNKVRRKKNQ